MKRKVLRILLAILAPVAGAVVGRPYSGLWLSHYFLGSGKEKRLPRRLERELLRWWHDEDASYENASFDLRYFRQGNPPKYEELQHVPADVQHPVVLYTNKEDESSGDIYTTIGGLLVWRNADGTSLSYLDVYNWHPRDSWKFNVSWLPFQIVVRGQDKTWEDIGGRSFLTRGTVALGGVS